MLEKRKLLILSLLIAGSLAFASRSHLYLPIDTIQKIDMSHAKCAEVSDTLATCDKVMVQHLPKLSATPIQNGPVSVRAEIVGD